MKIIMLGDYGAGKTTILYKIKLYEVITTMPTIGYNFENVKHKKVPFNVFDVPGHTRIWYTHFPNTDGVIYVIDSTDRNYVSETQTELHRVINEPELRNCVFLILANKQDLADAMSTTELIEKFKMNLITDREWHMQATSAVTGMGLEEGLDWFSNKLANR